MLKKQIIYTDYNGVERKEEFLFNLTKAEIAEMEHSVDGGLSAKIQKITESKDQGEIVKLFKELILASYGVKSEDGKRFIKSKELSLEFSQTEAYSELFMELGTNEKAASQFIEGIIPVVK